jgi:YesN/AraC family two-component response regulator
MGVGINTYITQKRVARAKVLLAETALTAADISRQVGFMSPGYFGQVFRKVTGMTPQQYRRSAAME